MNINKRSIEEKVGQLFLVGFDGEDVDEDVIHLISSYHIGGLFLQAHNCNHPKQVHHLTNVAQRFANKELPLFIAIQQIGGEQSPLKKGVLTSPTQQALGMINNRLYTKQVASHVAEELHAMGINMNVSPILHRHSENSFSPSFDLVAKHGKAMIEGYQKQSIIAAVTAIPSPSEWREYESVLHPLQKVMKQEVDAVVVDRPSRDVIAHLREELVGSGVILCTCENEDEVFTALEAGVDMVLMPHDREVQINTMNTVIEAVKNGDFSKEQLHTSVSRILSLKEKRKIGQLTSYHRENFRKKRAVKFTTKLQQLVQKNTSSIRSS